MTSSLKVAIALVAMTAIAVIVGSASFVLSKADQPRLAVTVKGVPGYVYYDRAYDLNIEYANDGGAISGPVELVVQLPETFALAQHVGEPSRRGERLTWTLDGLKAGEHGSISLTVQGVLPDDLTNAVYDLPGYVGHTAFVEGFDLGVTLTAGDANASTVAVADTGETPVAENFLIIVKDCEDFVSSQDFTFFWATGTQGTPPTLPTLQCGQTSDPLPLGAGPAGAALYMLREQVPDDWTLEPLTADIPSCVVTGSSVGLVVNYGQTDGVNFTKGAVESNDFDITCTFTNSPDGIPLTIVKDCGTDTSSGPFEFNGTEHLPSQDLADAEWDDLTLDCGDESDTYILQPQGNYTIAETIPGDWELTDVSCETVEGLDNIGYVYEGGSPDPVANGVRIMVPAAGAIDGQEIVCTFSNREYVDLTIIKDCGDDYESGPFEFEGTAHLPAADLVEAEYDGVLLDCGNQSSVFKLAPAGNYTLSEIVPVGWFLTDVSCVTTAGLDNTTFVYEGGSPDPVENGVRIMVPAGGAVDGQEIECTFTNTALDPFKKYTDWQDKVVEPGEYFTWYIQIPASEEEWTVTDYLPYGFKLAGSIYAPYQEVDCTTFGNTGFECTGATDTTVIIEVPVKAPDKCGVYKNRATLTYDLISVTVVGPGEHADSYVKVDDCRRERGARNPRAGR